LFEPALVGKAIADGRISSAAKEAFKRSRMTTGDRYFADLEKEKAQERANKKKRKHVFEPVHEELTSDATIEVHDSYILRQGKNVGVDAAETTKETLKRFRKTGFISIHDTPVVQARSGPPPPKARKRNDNTAFRLFPNTGQPFYSLYNAELCIQELESGHREKRIKYTKERLAKRDTTLQRLLLPALHIARQRPLLHMHKANSSTFNVIDPLRGGGSEPNYKLLRMPSLASQMRPRGMSKRKCRVLGPDSRNAHEKQKFEKTGRRRKTRQSLRKTGQKLRSERSMRCWWNTSSPPKRSWTML
jgi:hypothetical protein